ncbi:MAG: stage III sporulation protein AF [Christensenellaceae bacterium]
MSAYLLSIIGIVLLTAILSAVLPDGKTVKFIKGIAKLCCLAVILAPVLGFFKEASDGKINFPFFSSETVIETDGAFIDYSSTNVWLAETELEKNWRRPFVASGSPFCGITVRSRGRRTALSVRERNQNHQSVVDAEGNIDGEVRERMKAHIVEKYGCEVEFEE